MLLKIAPWKYDLLKASIPNWNCDDMTVMAWCIVWIANWPLQPQSYIVQNIFFVCTRFWLKKAKVLKLDLPIFVCRFTAPWAPPPLWCMFSWLCSTWSPSGHLQLSRLRGHHHHALQLREIAWLLMCRIAKDANTSKSKSLLLLPALPALLAALSGLGLVVPSSGVFVEVRAVAYYKV